MMLLYIGSIGKPEIIKLDQLNLANLNIAKYMQ